nr:MAG TPA: hypothetical protein [Caudoviricetes sp.]
MKHSAPFLTNKRSCCEAWPYFPKRRPAVNFPNPSGRGALFFENNTSFHI